MPSRFPRVECLHRENPRFLDEWKKKKRKETKCTERESRIELYPKQFVAFLSHSLSFPSLISSIVNRRNNVIIRFDSIRLEVEMIRDSIGNEETTLIKGSSLTSHGNEGWKFGRQAFRSCPVIPLSREKIYGSISSVILPVSLGKVSLSPINNRIIEEE